MKKDFHVWLLLCWVATVIALSVIPLSKDLKDLYENRFVRGDYLLHFLLFLVGYLIYRLSARGVGKHAASTLPRSHLIAILFLAFLAEAVQLLIPSRTFNLYDVMANYTGIAFGMVATMMLRLYYRSRLHRPEIIHDPINKTGFPFSQE